VAAALAGGLLAATVAQTALAGAASGRNYPGGAALRALPGLDPKPGTQREVHLDTKTAMTGASRFGQRWPFYQ
jgi:hypothetical protein